VNIRKEQLKIIRQSAGLCREAWLFFSWNSGNVEKSPVLAYIMKIHHGRMKWLLHGGIIYTISLFG